jgi:hypothetical protein
LQPADFCREIEAYLCRKNDGHLIRVTGPSFDLVSGWAERGVPLKVAFAGIDRYFERYYRKGPRRRPVRIDFCEADVLDVFDEWRRATGIQQSPLDDARSDGERIEGSRAASRRSLPEHLERVMLRLTAARVEGRIDAALDDLIDRVSRELDAARRDTRAVRGEARRQLIARLADLDRELLRHVRATLDDAVRAEIAREAHQELAPFQSGMPADGFARAREAAIDRLVRQRAQLPTIAFGP